MCGATRKRLAPTSTTLDDPERISLGTSIPIELLKQVPPSLPHPSFLLRSFSFAILPLPFLFCVLGKLSFRRRFFFGLGCIQVSP